MSTVCWGRFKQKVSTSGWGKIQYNTKTTKNFTLNKIDQDYVDPIVKAEREFFEIIKQEQEARLEQRQKKQYPSAQDLEWKLLLDKIGR